jgi:hypothetical protein
MTEPPPFGVPPAQRGRRNPTEAEKRVLGPFFERYRACAKRSAERRALQAEALGAVLALDAAYWTPRTVAYYFNNNRTERHASAAAALAPPARAEAPAAERAPAGLPPPPGWPSPLHADGVKRDHIVWFRSVHGYLREAHERAPAAFGECLRAAEAAIGAVLREWKARMPAEAVHSRDLGAKDCTAVRDPPSFQSATYAGRMPPAGERRLVRTAGAVWAWPRGAPRGGARCPRLEALYAGECGRRARAVPDCALAGVCARGALATVCFDRDRAAWALAYGGARGLTGFFLAPVAMLVCDDRREVWVAGDCRVKRFAARAGELRCVATLYAGPGLLPPRPPLAVWGASLALGVGQAVWLWPADAAGGGDGDLRSHQTELIVRRGGLSGDAVNWDRGIDRHAVLETELPGPVGCMAAADALLAVASPEHHAVHLLDRRGGTASRLLGHSDSVLSMFAVDKELFTGSADHTSRWWQPPFTSMQFLKNAGPVLALDFRAYLGRHWLVAADDQLVRVWDCEARTSAIDVDLEKGRVVAVRLVPESDSLVIITRDSGPYEGIPGAVMVITLTFADPPGE